MTFREAFVMAHAKEYQQWVHTASLLCLIGNLARDSKKHPTPFMPENFHQYMNKPYGEQSKVAPLEGLRSMYESFSRKT